MIPTRSTSSLKRTHGESPTTSHKRTNRALLPRPAASPVASSFHHEQTMPAVDSSDIGMLFSDGERSEDAGAEDDMAMAQTQGEDRQDPGNPRASAQRMAGVGGVAIRLNDPISQLGAGHAFARTVRRQLSIADDDHQQFLNNHAFAVSHLYDGITSVPADMDPKQDKMATFFNKKLESWGKAAADQYLANMASMVVADIVKLHREGDCLLPFQFESLHPTADDRTMKAVKRYEAICGILHKYKKHVVDLVSGGDFAVTKFVAAPMGHAKRKDSYVGNNKNRSDRLKQLKTLEASLNREQGGAEGGAEDDADGQDQGGA
jgi:hypothetical protein